MGWGSRMIERYRIYIISILLAVIGFGLYLIYSQPGQVDSSHDSKEVIVDISGAVKNPGVYNLTSEDRIIDAINIAGGLSKKADLELIAQDINQASFLEDEQKIFIPVKKAQLTSSVAPAQTNQSDIVSSSTSGAVVNINTATAAELESLPGIGQVYAQRIVDFRNQIGRFTSASQLLEVSGIGERTLEKIVPYISL